MINTYFTTMTTMYLLKLSIDFDSEMSVGYYSIIINECKVYTVHCILSSQVQRVHVNYGALLDSHYCYILCIQQSLFRNKVCGQ